MSTVLSNGVIVPDVGSTNWASDLETNWTLLNALIGAVGANVRLDRPNIWTAAQTFSEGIYGDLDGTAAMAVSDANGNEIATTYALKTSVTSLQTAVTDLQTAVASKAADNAVVHLAGAETITGDKTWTGLTATHNITPETDGTYSLGSSSYQWASVYARTYYYKGTAWGLDKANTWSGNNTYSKPVVIEKNTDSGDFLALKNSVAELGSTPASTTPATIAYRDKNDENLGYMGVYYDTDGSNYFRLHVRNKFASGAPSTSGTVDYAYFGLKINADKSKEAIFRASLRPYDSTNAYNLGNSTYKWKTLNGINPGALSLPDTYINLDTTDWNLTGTSFNYVPSIDGWLFINVRPNNNYAYAAIEAAHMRNNSENTTGRNAMACIAVRKKVSTTITLVGASIAQARLVSCAGNV